VAGRGKDTESLALALRELGVPAQPYHAKLSGETKLRTHEDWREGRTKVVCATSAFGVRVCGWRAGGRAGR
jgi:ATP-dependent DNA helicase RecQ